MEGGATAPGLLQKRTMRTLPMTDLLRRKLLTVAEIGVALALGVGVITGARAQMQVIYPDRAVSAGFDASPGGKATARRAGNGHYFFVVEVNGVPLNMMFDTGATDIALRAEDAAKIGVDVGSLNFSKAYATANGTARSASVVLNSVTIGGITRKNVRASVSQAGQLGVNLLGQSFTSSLAGLKVEGDTLVLLGGS
jgi:aspartyl protease family protein